MKSFLTILMTFLITFTYQMPSFSAVKEEKIVFENSKIQKQDIFNLSEKPFQLARRTEIIEEENNDYRWIASIFIVGLGQILMGDFLRGAIFLGINILSTINTFDKNLPEVKSCNRIKVKTIVQNRI